MTSAHIKTLLWRCRPSSGTCLQRSLAGNVGPKDAKEVIQQQDGTNTLFYLDPPYLDETRSAPQVYRHEMTRDQHAELLEVVKAVKGKVLLSGYDSALYQEELADWNRHAFELPNNAASGGSKRTMTEVVWCKF